MLKYFSNQNLCEMYKWTYKHNWFIPSTRYSL